MPARRLKRSTQVSKSYRDSASPKSAQLAQSVSAQKIETYLAERERGARNRRARQLAGFIRANVAARGGLVRM
jgi:hypothetical protein